MSAPDSADERDRLRLTVAGSGEVVLELGPGDVGDVGDTGGTAESAPEVRGSPASPADRTAGRRCYEVTIDGWVLVVSVESASRARLFERASQAARQVGRGGAQEIRAQIPGRVVRLWVADGDTVEAGQRLLAIEAMKMENEVRAPRAGVIDSIRVAVGASVELGNALLTVR